jgi:hypothetical protein
MINATRFAVLGVSAFAGLAMIAGGGVASAASVRPVPPPRPVGHCQPRGPRHYRDPRGGYWRSCGSVPPIRVRCAPYRSRVISIRRGAGRQCCITIRPVPLRHAMPVRGYCPVPVPIPPRCLVPVPRRGGRPGHLSYGSPGRGCSPRRVVITKPAG